MGQVCRYLQKKENINRNNLEKILYKNKLNILHHKKLVLYNTEITQTTQEGNSYYRKYYIENNTLSTLRRGRSVSHIKEDSFVALQYLMGHAFFSKPY